MNVANRIVRRKRRAFLNHADKSYYEAISIE
jgi:hypothetical protein